MLVLIAISTVILNLVQMSIKGAFASSYVAQIYYFIIFAKRLMEVQAFVDKYITHDLV